MTAAAAGVYCLWAGLLIAQKPGLYYDEALLVSGAVHMRHSPAEFDLPHNPHTWECKFHHCLPLMAGGLYIGAVKEYLCVPLFAIFGPRTSVIRWVSVALALIGIWGLARLIAEQVSPPAGAAVAFILAMNPAYINQTVFDNGAVAIVMAALGLVCAGFSNYLNKRSSAAAFWLGAAMGYGVWARANFVWTLVALGLAALVVFRRRFLIPLPHWAAIAGGGVLGGAPFLAFQISSKGGTWKALDMFTAKDSLWNLFYSRLYQISETFLSDGEHRVMWGRTFLPSWQLWGFPIVIVAACVLPWILPAGAKRTRAAARFAGVTLAVLLATMFLSRLQVTEHHFIAAVPIAAAAVVLASAALLEARRWAWLPIGALVLVYAFCAFSWNAASVRGLHRTGGIGLWSDAGVELAREVQRLDPAREIQVVDWGLQFNLYVMLDGKLHARVIDDPASDQFSNTGVAWTDEVRKGGLFLLSGPEDRAQPLPARGFLRALAELSPVTHRHSVAQRDGTVFAQFIEVEPGSHAPRAAELNMKIQMNDPESEAHLNGFYPIEGGQWRWTQRNFSVTFEGSEPAGEGARIRLELYVPDAVSQKLGPMTLAARMDDRSLGSATYREPGVYTFEAPLWAEWIHPGRMRIDFALDKAMPAAAPEHRELGIVVENFSVLPE